MLTSFESLTLLPTEARVKLSETLETPQRNFDTGSQRCSEPRLTEARCTSLNVAHAYGL